MESIKPTEESIGAVTLELASALGPGWRLSRVEDVVVLQAPDMPIREFQAEVWRLCRFVAYDSFVSIERTSHEPRAYLISSTTGDGLGFLLKIVANGAHQAVGGQGTALT